jgi:hypothetical protein
MSGNIKTPQQPMPACPRCGLNNQVYYYLDYDTDALRLSALHDYSAADYLADSLDLVYFYDASVASVVDAGGYIGKRTKFCFFDPVGLDKTLICDYRH